MEYVEVMSFLMIPALLGMQYDHYCIHARRSRSNYLRYAYLQLKTNSSISI